MNREKLGQMCIIFTITLILLAISSYYLTEEHELVHKRIMESYGCKEAEIKISIIGNEGETKCKETYKSENEEIERELHMENDILGYQMQGILSCGLLIVLGFTLLEKLTRERGEK